MTKEELVTWRDAFSNYDRMIYEKAGYGKRVGPGSNPAVIVIDVTRGFVGDKRESILTSIEKFPNSCGEAAWDAVDRIKDLLEHCRERKVPVIYTLDDFNKARAGRWADKHSRILEDSNLKANEIEAIPERIAPQQDDLIIKKLKPSAFFGTPLASQLISMQRDTLIVTGGTTSGCVRASVIDAFSYNFHVLIIEECLYDRSEQSHKVNLFEMNQKYGDVISLLEAKEYVDSISRKYDF